MSTLTWFLSRRFLFSSSSEGFLSFISWVAIAGIALGVLALTTVTSVINGFEGELIRVITSVNGEVILYSRGTPIQNPALVNARIRKILPQAQAVTASFVTELMLSGSGGVAGAVLEGIDPVTMDEVTEISTLIREGRLPQELPTFENEIALGDSLASKIGARVGDRIRLVVPFAGEVIEGGQVRKEPGSFGAPKIIEASVVGILKLGMHQYDSKLAYVDLKSLQRFLSEEDRVTSFRIKLLPGSDARKAADLLSENFGYPFRARDWSQLNKNMLYAIRLEKVVITIILLAIIIVAAFNVVSTLLMMIHDKAREISILKAMGLKPVQSFQLFCAIGTGIGAFGVGLGVLAGLAANRVVRSTRIIDLPEDIYYIGFLPVIENWVEIGGIAAVALAIAFVATLYPAIRVARRSPLEGMRYE